MVLSVLSGLGFTINKERRDEARQDRTDKTDRKLFLLINVDNKGLLEIDTSDIKRQRETQWAR